MVPVICLIVFAVGVDCLREQGVGYGKVVPIPAGGRIQYQRLGYSGNNTYKFGYDTGTGPSQSFREEERDTSGIVRGRYGFINPFGALHIVEYYADHTGFHIIGIQKLEPERNMPFMTTVTIPTTTTTPPRATLSRPPKRPLPPFLGPLPPFLPRPVITDIAT